jgi:putative membrane protein
MKLHRRPGATREPSEPRGHGDLSDPSEPREHSGPGTPGRHGTRLAAGLAAACFALSAGLVTAAAVAAPAQGATGRPDTSTVSNQDRAFMAAAAQANIAELSISKNVELRVAEPLDGVAAKYVSDHTTALAGLRQIAAGLGVSIPSAPSMQQLAEASQIESQSGHSLNVAFAQASVIAHEQAIVLFKQEVASGSNWKVKDYASAAMPVLNNHLTMAEQAASELGVSVAKMPQGAPATGAGGPAGVQQAWLFGLGGVALLAGLGILLITRRTGSATAAG